MAMTTQNKLYVALAVLAVLAGGLYFQNQRQKAEQIAYSPEGAAQLPNLELSEEATSKIDKITIQRPAGDAGPAGEVVLEKQGDEWRLSQPVSYKANENNVKSLISSLPRLKVTEQVASSADSYQAFGLTDELALHAVFHEGDKVVADLYFGEGGSRGQMARVGGRDGVFAIQGYASFSFGRDAKGWRDSGIWKFEEKKVQSLEIVNEHGTFSFVREEKKDDPKQKDEKQDADAKGDESEDELDLGEDDAEEGEAEKKDEKKDEKSYVWVGKFKGAKDAAPKPIERFDEAKVNDCLRAFRALNSDGFGDDKALSDVGLDTPIATLTIVLEDGARRVLTVGDTAEGTSRWIKTQDSDQIFSIASFAASWPTAELEKFQKAKEEK